MSYLVFFIYYFNSFIITSSDTEFCPPTTSINFTVSFTNFFTVSLTSVFFDSRMFISFRPATGPTTNASAKFSPYTNMALSVPFFSDNFSAV